MSLQLKCVQNRNTTQLDILWESLLPPDHATDPALWEELVDFFETATQEITEDPASTCITSEEKLKRSLIYRERPPTCLKAVLKSLKTSGEIVPTSVYDLSYFLEDGQNFESTASSLRKLVLYFNTACKIASDWYQESRMYKLSADQDFVLRSVLKRKSNLLISQIQETSMEPSDFVWTITQVAKKYFQGNEEEAKIVLAYLVKQGSAIVFSYKDQETAVQFLRDNQTRKSAKFNYGINESILSVKLGLEKLDLILRGLDKRIEHELLTAKSILGKAGISEAIRKSSAYKHLKAKKLLEMKYASTESVHFNLTQSLVTINQALSNMDLYKSLEEASKAIKILNENLEIAKVEETMENLKCHIDYQKQINEKLSETLVEYDEEELLEMEKRVRAEELDTKKNLPETQGSMETVLEKYTLKRYMPIQVEREAAS